MRPGYWWCYLITVYHLKVAKTKVADPNVAETKIAKANYGC